MKRLIVMLLSAACILMMTGCEGWFHSMPKNTVMIKKMMKENPGREIDYEGVLSQDAVKTLALKAANQYFGGSLTKDELQFEITAVDQNKLKELLTMTRPVKDNGKFNMDIQTELDQISGGLYYVTLTKTANSNEKPLEVIDLAMNAKDGDVLQISRVVRQPAASQSRDRKVIFEKANLFIEEKMGVPLSGLTLNEQMIRWGKDGTAEFYYTSKTDQTLQYEVKVNADNEVSGFSKRVMALLSYYHAE